MLQILQILLNDSCCQLQVLIVGKTVYVSVPDENLSTNPKSVAGVAQPEGVSVGRAEQRKEEGSIYVSNPYCYYHRRCCRCCCRYRHCYYNRGW